MEKAQEVLKKRLQEEHYNKLVDIKNPNLHRFTHFFCRIRRGKEPC